MSLGHCRGVGGGRGGGSEGKIANVFLFGSVCNDTDATSPLKGKSAAQPASSAMRVLHLSSLLRILLFSIFVL